MKEAAQTSDRLGIYVASKVVHAPKWQELSKSGVVVHSTWIHEAGEGQTADYCELSKRCLAEIAACNGVLLYCEPGEILKGALIEVGAALSLGKHVVCVGDCPSLSRVFRRHPLWVELDTIQAAVAFLEETARNRGLMNCCGTCVFYEAQGEHCRARPPHMRPRDGLLTANREWPSVYPEDWCGGYQPKQGLNASCA